MNTMNINEAIPSMGPGSFDPGNIVSYETQKQEKPLQWGRGLSTPEICPDFRFRQRLRFLQWGRGLSTPEIRIASAGCPATIRLQWGRGLSTPEIRRRRFKFQRLRRPSMGPGSFDPGNELPPARIATGLPTFNGAGVFRPRKSTYSRPYGKSTEILQWGRGLSTPEIRLAVASTNNDITSFNGAGVFRPRKYQPHIHNVWTQHPSMGPGSFDPGNSRCYQAVR